MRDLCREMGVSRSGFYKWRKRRSDPKGRAKKRMDDVAMFLRYHEKYPSHGYRWLNAKIRLDTGLVMSDQYAHRCCKYAGIKSRAKHYAYKRPGEPGRRFENLVLSSMKIDAPLQVIASDMTAFWAGGGYWELTLYMDLWNNEIVGYGLSSRRGDPETYYEGLEQVVSKLPGGDCMKRVLHTDQGSVYSSKAFNEILPHYGFVHSMSRAGTPTDNAAMEAVNGWAKQEMFLDFSMKESKNVPGDVESYIRFFNEERPACTLGYVTPVAYREMHAPKKHQIVSTNR